MNNRNNQSMPIPVMQQQNPRNGQITHTWAPSEGVNNAAPFNPNGPSPSFFSNETRNFKKPDEYAHLPQHPHIKDTKGVQPNNFYQNNPGYVNVINTPFEPPKEIHMTSVTMSGDESVIKNDSNKINSHVISVDSRNRDTTKYPNPNDYRIYLTNPLYEVKSVSLVTASLPRSQTLINSTNNTFEYNSVVKTLEPGNYTIDELTAALTYHINNDPTANIALSQASGKINELTTSGLTAGKKYKLKSDALDSSIDGIYIATSTTTLQTWPIAKPIGFLSDPGDVKFIEINNIAYLSKNTKTYNKIIFISDSSKLLDFARSSESHNPLHNILGCDMSQTINTRYVSPRYPNLAEQGYIKLEIEELEILETSGKTEDGNRTSHVVHKKENSFGKIIWAVKQDEMHYFKLDYNIIKRFHNPKPSLSSLSIKWKNWDDSLYDFNGLEHSMTIEVTSKN